MVLTLLRWGPLSPSAKENTSVFKTGHKFVQEHHFQPSQPNHCYILHPENGIKLMELLRQEMKRRDESKTPVPTTNERRMSIGTVASSLTMCRQSTYCRPKPSPGVAGFYMRSGRGSVGRTPLAASPLIELELREKHEHVGRYETQGLVPKLKVSGQPVASEVR